MMGELALEIEDMLNRGYSAYTVAQVLEIPVSWVTPFLEVEDSEF
jgi:hypothetical protein